jgi:hypothetical protein
MQYVYGIFHVVFATVCYSQKDVLLVRNLMKMNLTLGRKERIQDKLLG